MILRSVLDFTHDCLAEALEPGDRAVDATAGNGHDTLFLARQVESAGHVYAFDVQSEALTATRRRLDEAGTAAPVTLLLQGHEHMENALPPDRKGTIGAVTFNLGYLPGSDKTCITRPETTIPALKTAAEWLRPAGVITIVLYTGHEGGEEEARMVDRWAEGLDQTMFDVLRYQFVNQQNDPPYLIAVERTSG